jgi:hypothetical protein
MKQNLSLLSYTNGWSKSFVPVSRPSPINMRVVYSIKYWRQEVAELRCHFMNLVTLFTLSPNDNTGTVYMQSVARVETASASAHVLRAHV